MVSPVAKHAASGQDLFLVLGLEKKFSVTRAEIEAAYLRVSQKVHPDNHVQAIESERLASVQNTVLVNDAYTILRRPETRAEYLLALEGLVISDNERLPLDFLETVMTWREELNRAKEIPNGDSGAPSLDELADTMEQKRQVCLKKIEDAFDQKRSDALGEVKHQLIVLRYINRYLEDVNQALA